MNKVRAVNALCSGCIILNATSSARIAISPGSHYAALDYI